MSSTAPTRPSKTQKNDEKPVMSASFRMLVEKHLRNFKESDDETFEFPSILVRDQRFFVEELAFSLGLKHRISGNGTNLHVLIYKTNENLKVMPTVKMELRTRSMKVIEKALELLREVPDECSEAVNFSINLNSPSSPVESSSKSPDNVLSVPPKSFNPGCAQIRQQLPVFQFRQHILEMINNNQVVVIESSTGSGKSTQIPQYLLEEASERNQKCRILVAEPKRICATSLAERVSFERGEQVGGTVGFQIRLESKVAPTSNLIYVTNGVIIRMLMKGQPQQFFNEITALIIDEVHERDRMSDFLMLCVREFLHLNKNLKVVIMSATFHADFFASYFGNCPVFKLDGQSFDVKELFLEDTLKMLRFTHPLVDELDNTFKNHPELLEAKASAQNEQSLDDDTKYAVNDLLEKISKTKDCNNKYFQFFYMVTVEKVPVDFRCTTTNQTCLMIAVSYGLREEVVKLLGLGADPSLKVDIGGNEMNSYDIAMMRGDYETAVLLKNHMELVNEVSAVPSNSTETSAYDRALVDIYYNTLTSPGYNRGVFLEDMVDLNLAASLIQHIHFESDKALAILVFLPGHEEIVQLANLLYNRLDTNYNIFILHSQMFTADQINVFESMPPGIRKIIIATNIAESSITVNDCVYLIDCGKAKQKVFNPVNHVSSLHAEWISKASATQRKGRVGRTRDGVVFRLYSRDRYNHLMDNPVPEFLRCDMTDICLQVKLISRGDQGDIAEFLKRAITPPSDTAINYSIKILNDIGALNFDESLTQLGQYLADIPLNAKHGKMLIYGIFFKCIDPILTLVSVLSVGEPFTLTSQPEDRDTRNKLKKSLADESFSDHFVMLRIFQKWNEYKTSKEFDGGFCEDNFVNPGTMEIISATRLKIVAYLRSVRLIQSVGNMVSLNENSYTWAVIKLCIAAGSYPEVGRVIKSQGTIMTSLDTKVIIHHNSVLRNGSNNKMKDSRATYPTEWIVCDEKSNTGQIATLKMCTVVTSICLALSAGHGISINDDRCSDDESQEKPEPDQNTLIELEVDKFVHFSANIVVAKRVTELRSRLNSLMRRFLHNVDKFKYNEEDEILILGIVKILELEDEKAGFKTKYEGIGARPRVVTREADMPRRRFTNGNADFDSMANDHVEKQTDVPEMTNEFFQPPQISPSNLRYFITKMKSQQLWQQMKSNGISLMHSEAQLPDDFLDALLELEINDRVTRKIVIFYHKSEIVGAGVLEPFHDRPMTREKMKVSFMCSQKFHMSKLRNVTTSMQFKQFLNGSFAEIPKDVGKLCADLCLIKQ